MTQLESNEALPEDIAKRRVGCLISYLHPFRLIEAETLTPWSVDIEQVNHRSWDYVALHDLAGGIDVGLPSPYHLVLARDGALALPPVDGLRSQEEAVEFFNRCLAGLLIGGIYCEAITPDGIDRGSIIDWQYLRSHTFGQAAPNRFHEQIRHGQASPMEAIALHRPRVVAMSDLTSAMTLGLKVLRRVGTLRGEYLLKGVTGIARRDWGSGLANLWIAIEQLTSALWQRNVVDPTLLEDPSKSRRNQLGDTRTWTASARLEMLYQKGVLSQANFVQLSAARKARNDLSHEGNHPSQSDAMSAYEGFCGLLTIALDGEKLPLFELDLSNHSLSDPFAPPKLLHTEPQFWMAIPKLPGEADLERAEARVWEARRS